jgi:spermidine synthase
MRAESAVPCHLPVPTPMTRLVIVQLATFAGAIFVSAFLLFQVQPLIGKIILPWFGGSTAVWTTCMVFFQATLFLGYAYAHAIARWLSERHQRVVHLALISAALVVLPIAPNVAWKPLHSGDPTGRILLLLGASVGLPYFVLSATGPLLQSWFSRVCPGRSPYRLYSLSNVGSLLALVSYPLIVEPLWPSALQASVWSGVFLSFAVLCGACAIWVGATSRRVETRVTGVPVGEAPRFWQRTLWLVLPACSCLMLLATTNEVTQDVAPIPFLWVIPLGLYLLSFIICFDHEAWYRRGVVAPLTAVSLMLVAGLGHWTRWCGVSLTTTQELVPYFVALFGVCMVCHGEVVRLRPSPTYLTEFYLMLSAGGAIGGVCVSLIAPRLFATYFEWSLGLFASFLVAAVVGTLALRARLRGASAMVDATLSKRHRLTTRLALFAFCTIELVALVQIASWQFTFSKAAYRGRNFYGTVQVNDRETDGNEPYRSFKSGSTRHGVQWTSPAKRRLPTTYYGEGTAPALVVARLQSRPAVRIGVVGMGVGTLATYARPSDTVRFYEINPQVDLIAREFFTFLSDCRGHCDVVLGDARLALEREEPNQFDMLVLDAYNSDAPPIHLLTREAFEQFGRHLRPDGLLVVHVTNTYLELAPVVARLGRELGWKSVRIRTALDSTRLANRTDYLVFSREASSLPDSPTAETISDDVVRAAPLWTDQYSNLIQVLK